MNPAIKYRALRTGDAFVFEINGSVWVRAHGGFRPGCGGQLHTTQPNVIVYRWSAGTTATRTPI